MSGDGFFTFTDADPSQGLPKGIGDEREEHDAGAYASFALPQGSASRSASDDNSRGSFDSFGVKSKVLGSVLYDDEGLIPPGLGGHAYVDKSTSPKSTASPTAASRSPSRDRVMKTFPGFTAPCVTRALCSSFSQRKKPRAAESLWNQDNESMRSARHPRSQNGVTRHTPPSRDAACAP